ncbi:MAG: hypothetical protein ACREFZ_01415 [Acetobacteraceae bacterium]
MPRGEPDIPIRDGREPEGSRRMALVALLIVVAVVVGGLFLWNRLARMAAIQDCVASGRTNCVPVAATPAN